MCLRTKMKNRMGVVQWGECIRPIALPQGPTSCCDLLCRLAQQRLPNQLSYPKKASAQQNVEQTILPMDSGANVEHHWRLTSR